VTWVLDLDGVVWLSGRALPGAPEAIERLRGEGHRVLFLTNNSGPRLADHVAALQAAGVPAAPEDVVSSAHAAASLLTPGSSALVLGGPGVVEALEQRGVRLVGPADRPDAVVVGRTVEFGYDELAAASTAVRAGARFVATNLDPTYPTPDGLVPGAGAIVAAVQVAAGRDPEVAGKPFPPTAVLVRERADDVEMVVGDRLDTDGAVAHLLGVRFGLVLSGVTTAADLPADPPPDLVAADLAALVEMALGA
jgi:HAD superfamily hydrolase (TIGR01450 family)